MKLENQVPREGGVSTQNSGTHTLWSRITSLKFLFCKFKRLDLGPLFWKNWLSFEDLDYCLFEHLLWSLDMTDVYFGSILATTVNFSGLLRPERLETALSSEPIRSGCA